MPSCDFIDEDLFSSPTMSMHSSTHSSQMKTVGPAMRLAHLALALAAECAMERLLGFAAAARFNAAIRRQSDLVDKSRRNDESPRHVKGNSMEKSIVNEVVSALEAVKSYGQPGFWILLSILIVLVL